MGCGRSRETDEDEEDVSPVKGKRKAAKGKKNTGNKNNASGGPKAEVSEAAARYKELHARYTGPESIFDALSCKVGEHHPVQLVRLSYILRGETKAGRVLDRRQDLPARAFIGADELRKIWVDSGGGGMDRVLPVFSVSCGWETPEHPDPQGLHLAVLRKALKRQKKEVQIRSGQFQGFSEVGVFWDWASLLQGDKDKFQAARTAALGAGKTDQEALDAAWSSCRTEGEETAYRHALEETMDLWYGHAGITVVSANGEMGPEGQQRLEEEADGRHWFGDSGWVAYELCASRIVPRRRKEVTWAAVQDCGRKTVARTSRAIEDSKELDRTATGSDTEGATERPRRFSVSSASSMGSMSSIGSMSAKGGLGRRGSFDSNASASSAGMSNASNDWDGGQLLTSPWPVSADAFDELTAEMRFAHAPDRATVQAQYRRLAAETVGVAEVLNFSRTPAPNKDEARRFGQYLRGCGALRELCVERAGLTGKGMAMIVEGLIFEGSAEEIAAEKEREKAKKKGTASRGGWFSGGAGDNEDEETSRPTLLGELKVLDLHHNKLLQEQGVQALQGAFEGGAMPCLQVLNLDHCNMKKSGAQMLVKLFPYLPQLKELLVEANKLGAAGAHSIVEAISSGRLPMLVTLGLGANQMGDDGAESLAKMSYRPKFSPLSRLDLHSNEIMDAGAQQLAAAVKAGKLPKSIDLEGNWLEEHGIKVMERLGVKVLDQKDRTLTAQEELEEQLRRNGRN